MRGDPVRLAWPPVPDRTGDSVLTTRGNVHSHRCRQTQPRPDCRYREHRRDRRAVGRSRALIHSHRRPSGQRGDSPNPDQSAGYGSWSSRFRLVAEEQYAGGGRCAAGEPQRDRPGGLPEQPLPGAEHQRVDEQPVLVDDVVLDQRLHEDTAPEHRDGAVPVRHGGRSGSGVMLGRPSACGYARWGEAPYAFVVLREGSSATPEELITFTREHLAHFKAPHGVTFVAELPKTATGKIQKFVLRQGAPNLAR